jgi:hypothetical protein
MEIQVGESARQILVNNVPVEAFIGALALLVAFISLFIAIKTARETARANILNYLPVITLDYNNHEDKVIIKNVGRGTAVNIVLDKYYNWSADQNFKLYGLSTVVFETVNMLDAGKKVTVNNKIKGLPDSLGILTFSIFSSHTKNLDFIVKFKDISGEKYYSIIHIHKGKIEIRRFPSRLNIPTSLALAYHKVKQGILSLIYLIIVKYKEHTDNSKGQNN